MRFKKLRLFVAVSLIIFIFVVGNIVAFGKFISNENPSKDLPGPKLIAIVENKTNEVTPTPIVEKPNTVVNPTPTPTPVYTPPVRRTRAS